MPHSTVEGGGLLGGGTAPSHLKGPAPEELGTLDQTILGGRGLGWGVEFTSSNPQTCSPFLRGLHPIG